MTRTIGNKRRLVYDPDKIRTARFDAGLTQQRLADRVGISKSLVCRVEHGERQSPETISLIAKALKKRPQDFHFDKKAA